LINKLQTSRTVSNLAMRGLSAFSIAVSLQLVAFLVLPGCSKSGPSGRVSSNAFDSAPADVKKVWDDSMKSWSGKHYADAATGFISLQSKSTSLSPAQSDSLNKAIDEFGQEAFTVANNGDAEATKAVLALKAATGRRTKTAQ
jgi:hypothetical protein